MIDPQNEVREFQRRLICAGLDVPGIVEAFIEDNPLDWRVRAEIIPKYMPPHPRPETMPRVVVKCGGSFLRHSAGPRQGFFWDVYGDDMLSVGLAFKALLEAPCPSYLWFAKAHIPNTQ
jgi:hypothetical protein